MALVSDKRLLAQNKGQSRPAASNEHVGKQMQATRRRDTPAEVATRWILHAQGLRYRVDHPILGTKRRADILFSRGKVAVFIDGCFWHGCPEHGTTPKINRDWWMEKIQRNQQRDRDTNHRLRQEGWNVVRVWEHEGADKAAEKIVAIVRKRLRDLDSSPDQTR